MRHDFLNLNLKTMKQFSGILVPPSLYNSEYYEARTKVVIDWKNYQTVTSAVLEQFPNLPHGAHIYTATEENTYRNTGVFMWHSTLQKALPFHDEYGLNDYGVIPSEFVTEDGEPLEKYSRCNAHNRILWPSPTMKELTRQLTWRCITDDTPFTSDFMIRGGEPERLRPISNIANDPIVEINTFIPNGSKDLNYYAYYEDGDNKFIFFASELSPTMNYAWNLNDELEVGHNCEHYVVGNYTYGDETVTFNLITLLPLVKIENYHDCDDSRDSIRRFYGPSHAGDEDADENTAED